MFTRVLGSIFCVFLVTGSVDVSAMSAGKSAGGAVHPIITEKSGYVTIKGTRMGIWEPVVKDTLVLSSDFIRTAPNSWARVEFKGGYIEMYGSSLLYVPSVKGAEGEMDILDVALLKGVARFDIEKRNAGHPFVFRTENTIGVVKGTLFVVSTDDAGTNVAVYKGGVSLSNPDRDSSGTLFLSRGYVARIHANGTVEDVGVFNANKALLLLAEGVEPDISDEGLGADDAVREADGSDDSDVGMDRYDRDSGDDGDDVKDKDKDKDEDDKDKDDKDKNDDKDGDNGGDRKVRGKI